MAVYTGILFTSDNRYWSDLHIDTTQAQALSDSQHATCSTMVVHNGRHFLCSPDGGLRVPSSTLGLETASVCIHPLPVFPYRVASVVIRCAVHLGEYHQHCEQHVGGVDAGAAVHHAVVHPARQEELGRGGGSRHGARRVRARLRHGNITSQEKTLGTSSSSIRFTAIAVNKEAV